MDMDIYFTPEQMKSLIEAYEKHPFKEDEKDSRGNPRGDWKLSHHGDKIILWRERLGEYVQQKEE